MRGIIAALALLFITSTIPAQVSVARDQLMVRYVLGKKVIGAVSTPSAGYLGEPIKTLTTSAATVAITTGEYSDIATVTLTPGTWTIDGMAVATSNGVVTGNSVSAFIGTVTGNNTTGLVSGDNTASQPLALNADKKMTLIIAGYQVHVTTDTLYSLKLTGDFSAGTIAAHGRISARRER